MNNEKFKRQRRFMLVLPLLTLPFVTLAFWALGGGQPDRPTPSDNTPGLNMTLPEAKINEDTALGDKMSIYQKADQKAALRKEQMRMDPFAGELKQPQKEKPQELLPKEGPPIQSQSSLKAMETQVEQKLASLQKTVDRPAPPVQRSSAIPVTPPERPSPSGTDLKHLEEMMQAMSSPSSPDPELQQIDGMLEKILDVQHPERVRQKLEAYRDWKQGKTFAVNRTENSTRETKIIHSERKSTSLENNRFYGLDETATATVETVKPDRKSVV